MKIVLLILSLFIFGCPETPVAPEISPESIKILNPPTELYIGKKVSLTAEIMPKEAAEATVNWSAEPKDIVSVENGVLTALAEGTAVVTASTENQKTDSFEVTVASIRPASADVIPEPVSLTEKEGVFIIDEQTTIDDRSGESNVSAIFKETIRTSTGIELKNGAADFNVIRLIVAPEIDNDEAYRLTVTPETVEIRANGYGGFLYGFYTLLQLMPPEVYSKTIVNGLTLSAACCKIEDEPRFEYRGFSLDVSRHFSSTDKVKAVLDEMAKVKMNRFQWHLTDDGGVRFPFEGQLIASSGTIYDFDEFMKKAAWRTGNPEGLANPSAVSYYNNSDKWTFFDPNDAEDPNYEYREYKHGGFYTKAELKEIIHYAEMRNITIIPEIDMPGHAKPMWYLFEGLRCDTKMAETEREQIDRAGKALTDASHTDLCISNPDTIEVIKYMVKQVAEVFPGETIHIGADEVKINPNSSWQAIGHWWFCSLCDDAVQDQGGTVSKTTGYNEFRKLQARFLEKVDSYIQSIGKKSAIWSEGIYGDFTPVTNPIFYYWDHANTLQPAKNKRLPIVNADFTYYYLTTAQTQSDVDEDNKVNYRRTDTRTLEAVYNFDLTKDGDAGQAAIGDTQIGAQACFWAESAVGFERGGIEYSIDGGNMIYHVFPRLIAVAERTWSPEEKKDYNRFREKMQPQFERFDAAEFVWYCPAERDNQQ